MDLGTLEQRLIVLEDDLLDHSAVLHRLPRPDATWTRALSAAVMAISIFLLTAGALAGPYALVFAGIGAVLVPLEKLLDIYLAKATVTANASEVGAAVVRHQLALQAAGLAPAATAPPHTVPMPPAPPVDPTVPPRLERNVF